MGDYTPFDEMQEDGAEWRIEWDRDEEPTERTTTLTGLAWYAENFDDEATVTKL